jgi:phytoene dehydrogenase-like protein
LPGAAREAGVDIRTGVDVAQITVNGETATGVVLTNGEVIEAKTVVSNLDPRRTLLGLIDPMYLDPEFVRRVQNIRAHGTLAKINYAVSTAPRLLRCGAGSIDRTRPDCHGHRRHRARVRCREVWTVQRRTMDRVDGPVAPGPNARASQSTRRFAYVQYAPYHLRGTTWDAERERLADAATALIRTPRARLHILHRRARNHYAARSRTALRHDRRAYFSR